MKGVDEARSNVMTARFSTPDEILSALRQELSHRRGITSPVPYGSTEDSQRMLELYREAAESGSSIAFGTYIVPYELVVQSLNSYDDIVRRHPFENPFHFRMILVSFGELIAAFSSMGFTFSEPPSIATLPTGSLNARIVRGAPLSAPIVILESGFVEFLHVQSQIFSRGFPPTGGTQKAGSQQLVVPGFDRVASYLEREQPTRMIFVKLAHQMFVKGTIDSFETGTTLGAYADLAAAVFDSGLTFTIAHELAHLVIDRASDVREERVAGVTLASTTGSLEFDADDLAFRACMKVWESREGGETAAYLGWEYFLCSLSTIRAARLTLECGLAESAFEQVWRDELPADASSHPPARARQLRIRQCVMEDRYAALAPDLDLVGAMMSLAPIAELIAVATYQIAAFSLQPLWGAVTVHPRYSGV